MNNLVFYRKYRPKSFSEVVGQEYIIKTITNAISSEKVSHAYLFCGPKGSGKTTVARLLAKAVNCEDMTGFEPCNKCANCIEISRGASMDLLEIDAASHRGIDDIRELKEGIRFAPTRSKKKVYIIDESHQLTKEASNALLKMLEEAPDHVVFILATTEAHKMIPTIISRCQRFDFRKLILPEIVKRLEILAKKEKIKISNDALRLIASNSEGALRDAESLLGQISSFFIGSDVEIKGEDIEGLLGLVDTGLVSGITDLIIEKKAKEALNYINDLLDKGKDPQEFLKALINYLRKALVLKVVGSDEAKNPNSSVINSILTGLTKEDFQKLQEQVSKTTREDLIKTINTLLEAQNKMRYASIIQLPLELAIVDIIGITE
ncbi:MAG: DNA polymerase III subunit gamma/tau [Candidatus Nealsonbacteria bacterium]|nr:DNA polymerase III subunit gamma/tau [Candidatus Nealsonbacteria bacterium]